ncbi:MAG: rhodanese-like domain-containing protein, partial [Desulfobacterales bacterium]|nr:rhodanese-like domain-containing protein [Desulfobacterales bacterium]
ASPPGSGIALLFTVDDDARGVLRLGPRLTREPYGARDQELLSAFAGNFLVFLKNAKSFETIRKLGEEREKKNIELENTVKALSASRRYIAGLEKTGERIKAAVAKTMARSTRASILDMALILIAGVVLGLVYNFASPGGVHIIPDAWRRPAPTLLDAEQAQGLFDAREALFVDARPAEFYKERRLQGAVNLPPALFDFIYMMRFSQLAPERPIVVYGRNISRRYDEETAFRLSERGHGNVLVFPGGVEAWEKTGGALEP